MRTLLLTLCASLGLARPGAAQDVVSVFEGTAGAAGSVSLYDAQTGLLLASPGELAGIAFLPYELAGRTELFAFSPTQARRFTDVPQASRLRLPQQRGSLYHFARPSGSTQASYGLLLVPKVGAPRILIERPGIGAGGGRNPFLSHVSVAPDGAAVLVGTHGEGGGDLLEIETTGAFTIVDRTAGTPPLRVFPWGLVLGATHGFAVTNVGVRRWDRANSADAALVGYGADVPPTHFSGSIRPSADTSHVVFTAGSTPQSLHVWSAGGSGDARRATQTPGIVSPMGSVQDGAAGPWLAVSDDGVWCAWRTTIGPANECMVARAEPVPAAAEQLTSNVRFTDTLDEVALFAFRGPSRLLFAVGEQNAGGPPGKVDLFAADLAPAQTPQFSNLTQTSGQTVLPFTAIPNLEPARIALFPDQSGALIFDDQAQLGTLYAWRDGQNGVQVLLPSVKSLDDLEFGGPGAILSVRRDNNLRELYRATSTLTGLAIVDASALGNVFDRALTRADGWTAYFEEAAGGSELVRVDTVGGASDALIGGAAAFGPALSWSGNGSLVFTRLVGTFHAHLTWPIGGRPIRMLSSGAVGQILPSY